MVNEQARAEMLSVLGDVREQLRMIARMQQDRARLTASASVRNKRVTVTVNADGVVVETKFGPGIDELGYGEIARAVTEAAQQAAAEVARRGSDLLAPLHDQRARLPKLTDLIEGMPDIADEVPTPMPAPLTKPDGTETDDPVSAEGGTVSADADDAQPVMLFTDVESRDHDRKPAHGVTESSW
ncbi:YbaB/EbfC family nucleoid-associated protein [Nocardia sp. CC227C]|uniref:YbaB/EbfC family nucleoid-associated protein n=1 Tax=Nocardia sp. CC227C TaxID=3044562 RepID=UPI00278BC17E|nr:YbaB/EbfC family nucleoid-associated protein [Nocardia sp. CC227C]